MKSIIVVNNLSSFANDATKVTEVLNDAFNSKLNYDLVYPEKESGKKKEEYSVKQIRKFNIKLSKKLDVDLSVQVYVILFADKMSGVSQNALLKTLEESKYSICLVVENLENLLPTIQSRCQVIYSYNSNEEKENNFDEITFDNISSISKLEREEVKKMLISKLNNSGLAQVDLINDSIKKIDANCKVESILFDLVNKLKPTK